MRPVDIVNKSDNRSKSKDAKQNIPARLYKVENNKILYAVSCNHTAT